MAWDFTGGNETQLDSKSWRDREVVTGRFEKTKGNILCVILPVKSVIKKLQKDIEKQKQNIITPNKSQYINVYEILNQSENEDKGVSKLIKNIHSKFRRIRKNDCLIVDFANVEIHSRSLYWIIVICMHSRIMNKEIVIVDIPANLSRLIISQIANQKIEYKNTPLSPIQYVSFSENKNDEISFNYKDERPIFRNIDEKWIIGELNIHRKDIIKKLITKSYKPKERVYLPGPSKGFLKGYFQLADMLSDETISYMIASILFNEIKSSEITHVVLTTNILYKTAKNLVKYLNMDETNIIVYKNDFSLFNLTVEAKKKDIKIAIISDVNITNNTVNHIFNHINCKTYLISIINSSLTDDIDHGLT